MRLITPDYYEEFKCIAGDCPESCCIGWELDIDPDTLAYYRTVKGPLGERLAACIEKGVVDETASFHLAVNGRCPFLGEDGLCDDCRRILKLAISPAPPEGLDGLTAGIRYCDQLRTPFYRFKDGERRDYTPFFAQFIHPKCSA